LFASISRPRIGNAKYSEVVLKIGIRCVNIPHRTEQRSAVKCIPPLRNGWLCGGASEK
jgi:hypothetical protein